jgi:hypothetical protein
MNLFFKHFNNTHLMKRTLLIASCAMMTASAFAQAQTTGSHKCGIDLVKQKIAQQNPQMYQAIQQGQAAAIAGQPNGSAGKPTGNYTIPVVFHFCLTQSQFNQIGGNAGIAQRVDSQMAVLNRDFAGTNADSTTIPTVFKPLFAHSGIKFGLAHTGPNGHATAGWEVKIVSGTDTVYDAGTGSAGSGFACSDAKYAGNKGLGAWDPAKYYNIWVCDITYQSQQGILGITVPPSFTGSGGLPVNEKGVVVSYLAFGKRKSAFDLYFSGIDKGRTLTHETGHFFELLHIWGDTEPGVNPVCTDDDGIGDTPKQSDAHYGVPTFPQVSCSNGPNGDMFMNYMDYVDDAAMKMFSLQQANVMNQQLATNGESVTLTQNTPLTYFPTGINETTVNNQFVIAPNPAKGAVNISFGQPTTSLKDIRITNMMGQQVKSLAVNGQSTDYNIDLSGVSKGIYFVQCIFADEMISRKIVVE